LSADAIRAEMLSVWEADDRPWVVGFSGGKDSTCVVQLAWGALKGARRKKPLHVIASDTLVESPAVVKQLSASLDAMAASGRAQGLDVRTNLVSPVTRDTFWSCMLGRGMAAPTRYYRWCTSRLKIDNADRYIKGLVSEHGEVVMVLGQRKAESGIRKRVMERHEIKGSVLSTHGSLPNAYVYTPIRDLDAEDVWSILLAEKNPWGADNGELARMYRNANGGECPLVVDKSSPSCGNSRFGCWTCTVVDKDFSLKNTIDSGEGWMRPLLKFRNRLKDTQRPERWPEVRDYRRATGKYQLRDRGFEPGHEPEKQLVPGPYKWSFTQTLLADLLIMERDLARDGHPMTIISDEEGEEIQKWWRIRHGDWSGIGRHLWSVYGRKPLKVAASYKKRWPHLREYCAGAGVDETFLARLISIVEESPSRRRMRHELRYLANYDPRTDLAEVVRDLRAQKGADAPVIQTTVEEFA